MGTLHFRRVERRRTARVALCVELIVQGSTENNRTFKVKARTLSVSRHGGMMVMDPEVAMDQNEQWAKSGMSRGCNEVGARREETYRI